MQKLVRNTVISSQKKLFYFVKISQNFENFNRYIVLFAANNLSRYPHPNHPKKQHIKLFECLHCPHPLNITESHTHLNISFLKTPTIFSFSAIHNAETNPTDIL